MEDEMSVIEKYEYSECTMLKLEQIGLLEEMAALLEDRPLPNGEYIHILTCNASRREPVGNEMCSCPIGRRIKNLKTDLKRVIDVAERYISLSGSLSHRSKCGCITCSAYKELQKMKNDGKD